MPSAAITNGARTAPEVGDVEGSAVVVLGGAGDRAALDDAHPGGPGQAEQRIVQLGAWPGHRRVQAGAPGEVEHDLAPRWRAQHHVVDRGPRGHVRRLQPERFQPAQRAGGQAVAAELVPGNRALSTSVTSSPPRANVIAAAEPAGPPPTTTTSVVVGSDGISGVVTSGRLERPVDRPQGGAVKRRGLDLVVEDVLGLPVRARLVRGDRVEQVVDLVGCHRAAEEEALAQVDAQLAGAPPPARRSRRPRPPPRARGRGPTR